jgi:hypothetical protein
MNEESNVIPFVPRTLEDTWNEYRRALTLRRLKAMLGEPEQPPPPEAA